MELLIILFAVAFSVWMVPVVQSGRLFLVALSVLAVGTVFGPSFFAFDGPIQFSLDRVLWMGAVVLAVIGWRLGYTRLPQFTRVDWVVIAVVGWFFVSALRGGPVPTGSSPVARWLFYIAMPAGMYAVARVGDVRRSDVRWLLGGSIALGFYLAITAILETSGLHSFVFPSFIADPDTWEFYGRGRGPLLNPSGNGYLMSIAFVAVMLGFLYAGRRGKLLYGVCALVLLAGVYATLTRSAWLGLACSAGLVALLYSPRWCRVLGLATAVILGGFLVAGMKDQFIRMKRDVKLTAADAEKSIKLRPLLALVAWEMFKDQPIIGHGYGHYFEHNDRFHNDRSYGLPLDEARTYAQHNVLLSILVDTGLVGCCLFVSWLVMLAGIGWRLAREVPGRPETRWVGMLLLGCLMAYFSNGMFQDVMIIPMVHMFLFFLAGAAVTAHQRGLVAENAGPAAVGVPRGPAVLGSQPSTS